jgi:hypothetical protein
MSCLRFQTATSLHRYQRQKVLVRDFPAFRQIFGKLRRDFSGNRCKALPMTKTLSPKTFSLVENTTINCYRNKRRLSEFFRWPPLFFSLLFIFDGSRKICLRYTIVYCILRYSVRRCFCFFTCHETFFSSPAAHASTFSLLDSVIPTRSTRLRPVVFFFFFVPGRPYTGTPSRKFRVRRKFHFTSAADRLWTLPRWCFFFLLPLIPVIVSRATRWRGKHQVSHSGLKFLNRTRLPYPEGISRGSHLTTNIYGLHASYSKEIPRRLYLT